VILPAPLACHRPADRPSRRPVSRPTGHLPAANRPPATRTSGLQAV